MSDTEVEAIASEPLSAKRQREFLEDRIKKLQDGHEIFRGVIGSGGTDGGSGMRISHRHYVYGRSPSVYGESGQES